MAVVENSHRDDDEYFLMIHAERCNNTKTFLYKAQQWQDTWNFYKPSHGKGMNGFTSYGKLRKSKSTINPHVLKLPVMLMEDLLKTAGITTMFLKSIQTGKYVYTKCLSESQPGQCPFFFHTERYKRYTTPAMITAINEISTNPMLTS